VLPRATDHCCCAAFCVICRAPFGVRWCRECSSWHATKEAGEVWHHHALLITAAAAAAVPHLCYLQGSLWRALVPRMQQLARHQGGWRGVGALEPRAGWGAHAGSRAAAVRARARLAHLRHHRPLQVRGEFGLPVRRLWLKARVLDVFVWFTAVWWTCLRVAGQVLPSDITYLFKCGVSSGG
jgi:hypothetical protein